MTKQLILGIAIAVTTYTISVAQSLPTIVVDSSQLSPSAATQTTSIDVWVAGNGATPIDLAGFQLTISLGGTDELVRILDVGTPDSHPYLFDPTSIMPSGLVDGDGLSVELGDFLDTGISALDDGDGLASIAFEVEPGALGSYQVEVSLEPAESFLAESLSEFVAFNVQNGQVTIVIPEPRSLLLALLGLGATLQVTVRGRVVKGPCG